MQRRILLFLAVSILVFAIYLWSSAPGIGLVDSGELSAVAYSLGIAHPTGYPLYTLLGHLWLSATGLAPSRGMVIFSALVGSLACGFLALIGERLLLATSWSSEIVRLILAGGIALGFALTKAAWTSISFAEVYPLSWLAVAVILWLSTLMVGSQSSARTRILIPLATIYIWGLSFGNHLTILWFAPLMLWIGWQGAASSLNWKKFSAVCIILFGLGASINLFLPLRSTVDPALDWGDPQTIPNLLRHLSAWQYRVWMFKGDWLTFFGKFFSYIGAIPSDVGWAFSILSLLGAIQSVLRRNWFALTLVLVWLIGTSYNMNYEIPDISTYFLIFYCPLFVLTVIGFKVVAEFLWKLRLAAYSRTALIALSALLIPLASLASARSEGIVRHDRFAEIYLDCVLSTLPDSALVIQGNWDIESPFIYDHYIGYTRPDVVMLDINLMQRSWYVKQERRNHPDIFRNTEGEVRAFLHAVSAFESGDVYNGNTIESAFVAMNNAIIRNQLKYRPVYIRDLEETGHPQVAASYPKVPGGYFFRISGDSLSHESVFDPESLMPYSVQTDTRRQYLLKQAFLSAVTQGRYAISVMDTFRIRAALEVCRQLRPDDPLTQSFEQIVSKALRGK